MTRRACSASTTTTRNLRRTLVLAALGILLHGITISLAEAAPTNGTESKCQAKLAKAVGKVWKTAAGTIAKCRDSEIAGKGALPCPDVKGKAKIDKAVAKIATTAAKSCGTVCSISSSVTCLSDSDCPPNGASSETCTGDGSSDPFKLSNLGFPGAFCPALLGGPINGPDDLGQCLGDGAAINYGLFVDTTYGSIDSSANLSRAAASCLKAAGKSMQKVVNAIFKSVSKCRDGINKNKITGAPSRCKIDDQKTADSIAKALDQLDAQLAAKCSDDDVMKLDICSNGVGGTLTVAAAAACLGDAAEELGDTLDDAPIRDLAPVSLVDVMFPPALGVCGDGVANQLPHPFLMRGEECDRLDDGACPGECLPPGDLFECTCGNIKRFMNVSIGDGSDLDIGWTGFAHSKQVANGAAYVTDVSGCDCDLMDGAECIGTSIDPVCNLQGNQLPTCSWELFGTTACDDRGDGDANPEDADCSICDAFSSNAGSGCSDESDCQSQCHDAGGSPTGPCSSQSDCAGGEVCRGHCDSGQTCIALPHGPSIPLVSGGAPTCLLSPFTDDVVGTQNIVTGEHVRGQFRRTVAHTGEFQARPCPICGGFCEDATAALNGRPCQGTCSISGDRCRFDLDCPDGETCTSAAIECGQGLCNLELVCLGGTNSGGACRLHGPPGPLGSTSTDCPPDPNLNYSALGTPSNFDPLTSETVALDPAAMPCSAPLFQLYDCPCPDDGGAPTRPNQCAFACNAGAEFGIGCATGGNVLGAPTRCVGGVNDGVGCDEDADCASGGGTCTGNPTHCTGDPALERVPCTTDGQCGTGTCVDACPSGDCVLLCTPKASDPEEGECVAGPTTYFCDDEPFRPCSAIEFGATCDAVCSIAATSCASDSECPTGETCAGDCLAARSCEAGSDGVLGTSDDLPGAGVCTQVLRDCFLPDLAAEGGDIFNGNGDAINQRSVSAYCTEANVSAVPNFAAGLGGPGRIRSNSVNLTNGFATLP